MKSLDYFPEIGTTGIEFVNTTNPDSGSIVLTMNGSLNSSSLRIFLVLNISFLCLCCNNVDRNLVSLT